MLITNLKEQTMKKTVVLLWSAILIVCVSCRGTSEPSKPLIGITSVYKIDEQNNSFSTSVNFAYVQAVADNGGIPLFCRPSLTKRLCGDMSGIWMAWCW